MKTFQHFCDQILENHPIQSNNLAAWNTMRRWEKSAKINEFINKYRLQPEIVEEIWNDGFSTGYTTASN